MSTDRDNPGQNITNQSTEIETEFRNNSFMTTKPGGNDGEIKDLVDGAVGPNVSEQNYAQAYVTNMDNAVAKSANVKVGNGDWKDGGKSSAGLAFDFSVSPYWAAYSGRNIDITLYTQDGSTFDPREFNFQTPDESLGGGLGVDLGLRTQLGGSVDFVLPISARFESGQSIFKAFSPHSTDIYGLTDPSNNNSEALDNIYTMPYEEGGEGTLTNDNNTRMFVDAGLGVQLHLGENQRSHLTFSGGGGAMLNHFNSITNQLVVPISNTGGNRLVAEKPPAFLSYGYVKTAFEVGPQKGGKGIGFAVSAKLLMTNLNATSKDPRYKVGIMIPELRAGIRFKGKRGGHIEFFARANAVFGRNNGSATASADREGVIYRTSNANISDKGLDDSFINKVVGNYGALQVGVGLKFANGDKKKCDTCPPGVKDAYQLDKKSR